jgi:hypothetical protein
MTILIVILCIIALPFVIALFVKKDYHIEREVVINKSNRDVFNYTRFLKNQDHYSKWVMADPNKKTDFRGTDGDVGFVYAWDGNKKAGKGEQEIINLITNRQVDCEVRFEKPFEGIAYTSMTTLPVSDNSTRVTWSMNGRNNYPMNISNLFMPGILRKDLEQSLATLKSRMEN